MPSVFKLVSCKPEAFRELALTPPRPEKLKIIKISLSFCYCTYRDKFDFVDFLIIPNFEGF